VDCSEPKWTVNQNGPSSRVIHIQSSVGQIGLWTVVDHVLVHTLDQSGLQCVVDITWNMSVYPACLCTPSMSVPGEARLLKIAPVAIYTSSFLLTVVSTIDLLSFTLFSTFNFVIFSVQ